jgi:hypothetical protein
VDGVGNIWKLEMLEDVADKRSVEVTDASVR